MADFNQAITYVLQNEGGFIDDPDDPGGATNFGITTAMLSKFRNGSPVSAQSMKELTVEEAKAVYRAFFWDQLKLDPLPQAIATALLDSSVNEGEFQAVTEAQRALGLIAADGIPGSKTMAALQAANEKAFILAFVGYWISYYIKDVEKTISKIKYLDGWIHRALRLLSLI